MKNNIKIEHEKPTTREIAFILTKVGLLKII